ncbi:MAG: hemerythrin domain-containing protein [Bacteroidales bacterium]|jgi:regulator of cell morphogenesis and NO signaling|nr:hemerythrin domain-containing protein [Bacteroidales bacterium]
MKMSDLLLANHNLVPLLPRFDIVLGFGEKTIQEVCEQKKVSPSFFLMVCNIYTFDDYIPSGDEIAEMPFQIMKSFMTASHHYYLYGRLPHIERHLQKIAEACNPKLRAILLQFFTDYKAEVANHFSYEEEVVIPYIEGLLQGVNRSEYKIHEYEANHSNIEDKLDDLTNIIIKYLPAEVLPNEKASVLFDIFQLSFDLNKHKLIEDNLLIPYVETIEKQRG